MHCQEQHQAQLIARHEGQLVTFSTCNGTFLDKDWHESFSPLATLTSNGLVAMLLIPTRCIVLGLIKLCDEPLPLRSDTSRLLIHAIIRMVEGRCIPDRACNDNSASGAEVCYASSRSDVLLSDSATTMAGSSSVPSLSLESWIVYA